MPGPIRILLVEDEPALLKLMKSYLERLGYEVEAHATGSQAMAAFEQTDRGFSLLIADMTLPDMPGLDLALALAKQSEILKVLLCSGYPFDVSSIDDQLQHRFRFLQKPFLPGMLSQLAAELSPVT